MTLKRLEMHGFKSFAKKAVFDFSAPVTAIVGPNGSGKSNVVEAIRFVLGEQSQKSLRSKSGADLIFKGSKQIGKMARASVVITFDNSGRIFSLPSMDGETISLDFDEITIAREVYADGGNTYSLNGNEVRLKDIHELIASVNIGSSGHHIISQGEADRLLNSKPVERREMLEESLGLKLYHYRIREAARKLEKTREHVREAESLRRELAPHIKFLKKQVEKIEKAREIEIALVGAYQDYLVAEQTIIARQKKILGYDQQNLQNELGQLDEQLRSHGTNRHSDEVARVDRVIEQLRTEIKNQVRARDEIGRQIGRIEGMIEVAGKMGNQQSSGASTVSVGDIEALIEELEEDVQVAVDSESASYMKTTLGKIAHKLRAFIDRKKQGSSSTQPSEPTDTSEFEASKYALEQELIEIDGKIAEIESRVTSHESEREALRAANHANERAHYESQAKRNEIASRLAVITNEMNHMIHREDDLASEYDQAAALVGSSILDLKHQVRDDMIEIDEVRIKTLHHDIERMKIRLEDMGGGGGGDVLAEYNDTTTRDQFLEKEINDLYTAIGTLESTIADLQEKLSREFKSGITKINREFETFFKLMFGGGDAKLEVVDVVKRGKNKTQDMDEEDGLEVSELEEEEKAPEQGIDIDVSLPRKKVKDLEMLSGGERSLTSIALLFALSQVNPPPFLVLDETDAALDEANSQKYGDMIENLAKQTQLVVVTHNRETMGRADILYGVTLGSDDASTLLSIKFEEAVKVAK